MMSTTRGTLTQKVGTKMYFLLEGRIYLDELEESVVQATILEIWNYSQTSHTNQSPSFGKR